MNISNRLKRAFSLLWGRLDSGVCPDSLQTGFLERTQCNWWGNDPVADALLRAGFDIEVSKGCRLADECGPICSRDPQFQGSGELETGHTAGFDFFSGTYCDEARRLLPTQETREFWFPPEYDPKAWRRERYQRRKAWKVWRVGAPG